MKYNETTSLIYSFHGWESSKLKNKRRCNNFQEKPQFFLDQFDIYFESCESYER